jgi:predicted nucleic acid-binding protein
MDKAVIDSRVAIKWCVVEPYSDDARWVLNEYQAGTLSLLAPALRCAEVGNIVWKKQRFQGLAAADADLITEAFRMVTCP